MAYFHTWYTPPIVANRAAEAWAGCEKNQKHIHCTHGQLNTVWMGPV